MTNDNADRTNPGQPNPRAEHPGFILLRTVLGPRGIKQSVLAARTGVPLHSVNQLLDGHRPFRTENARLFGVALDIAPATILKWQNDYDLDHPKPKRPPRKRRGPRRPKRPGNGTTPPAGGSPA